jgi:hypothetical protein
VIRFRWRRPGTDEPRGVRILHGDGSVTECSLVRDPQDRRGRAWWIAVPPPGTVFSPLADHVVVEYLPGRTAITLTCDARLPF